MRTTCFTDLAGSTLKNTELGNEGYTPIAKEHLRVARTLLEHSTGAYVKDAGDATMVAFDDYDDAISWAVRLMQYYDSDSQHGVIRSVEHRLKLGLALGAVDEVKAASANPADYFGAGVNEAARVQSKSTEGQVLVNDGLFRALGDQWSRDKRDKYVKPLGTRKQKGLNPEYRPLYELDWRRLAIENAGTGLDAVIANAFEDAGVSTHDLDLHEGSGLLVWPVVPRLRVTAIHRAQAQVISLMCLLGWEATLLVADCSSPQTADDKVDSTRFCEELGSFCERQGFRLSEVKYLSAIWSARDPDRALLQEEFRSITSDLSFEDLQRINNKQGQLAPDDFAKVNQRKALDNLRPALSGAAVNRLAAKYDGRTVVVAGFDEQEQWRRITSLAAKPSHQASRVMIPVLKVDDQYVVRQRNEFPSWDGVRSLQADLENEKGNMASWIFHCHVLLPAFPARKQHVGEILVSADWECDDIACPDGLSMKNLAQLAWPVLQ